MNRLVFVSVIACAAAGGCSSGMASSEQGDPIGFRFESTAGSFASFGWTGAVHDVVQPPGTPFGVDVIGCSGGLCQFQGPSDPGGVVNRKRCLFPMSKTCNSNSDCPPLSDNSANSCVYVYDTPIATPLLGRDKKYGACAWSYIPINAPGEPPTISGTLDLTSGALNFKNLSILLPLNSNPVLNTFRGACAECVGDTTPNDGIKNGHCQLATHRGDSSVAADPDMSPDLGMPCDVNRTGDFGGYAGNYSMDCSPTVLTSLYPPLQFGGSFTSSGLDIALTAQSPRCSAGGPCFCGMCQDKMTACMADKDCPAGPCKNPTTAETLGDPTRVVAANACPTGVCVWNADAGTGTCEKQQVNDPTIRCYASGDGAHISAPGHMERVDHVSQTYLVNTAGARCIPAGMSAPLNGQLGLPGLLFQKRNFQIIPRYAEDKQ